MNIIQKYLFYKKLMNIGPTAANIVYGNFSHKRIDWTCRDEKCSYDVISHKYYIDEFGTCYSATVRQNDKTVAMFFDGYKSRKLFNLAEKSLKKTR